MHVHANAMNPNVQMDALYAAQRAAGKEAAARIRKKLSEFASELAGEADSGEACVVKLAAREETEEQRKRQDQKSGGQTRKDRADSEQVDRSISDWA
jgi:hypothetical protein